jgi:hypothetical protein
MCQIVVSEVKAKIDGETGKIMASTYLTEGEKEICVLAVHFALCRLKDRRIGIFTLCYGGM